MFILIETHDWRSQLCGASFPISMVLWSEGSLKSEMLSLARTSKYMYVNNTTSMFSINKSQEDS